MWPWMYFVRRDRADLGDEQCGRELGGDPAHPRHAFDGVAAVEEVLGLQLVAGVARLLVRPDVGKPFQPPTGFTQTRSRMVFILYPCKICSKFCCTPAAL